MFGKRVMVGAVLLALTSGAVIACEDQPAMPRCGETFGEFYARLQRHVEAEYDGGAGYRRDERERERQDGRGR
jgi:hypothetical protein